MGIIDRLKNVGRTKKVAAVQMMTEQGNGFFAWNGKLYQSDIVRSAIRPYVTAIGKLIPKEIYETKDKDGNRQVKVNPDAYMRFLLEEPNPYMTGQVMRERLGAQLILNGNAFALILRDDAGFPKTMMPIDAVGVEAVFTDKGELYHRFTLTNGKVFTLPDADIIHLRRDYFENDLYGTPIGPALEQLMNIVSTTDQGIVKAVKNSAVIRWLLKFVKSLKPEDLEARAQDFAESFLRTENGTGVAAIDANVDAHQIDAKDYVPNAAQMDRATQRIYALFSTNGKIVNSTYTENEWNSYFDAQIEPVLIQLGAEFTRKLFTRRERAFGNRIEFEASAWDSANLTTKLQLVALVDRGAMTPNEWRATFNLAPLPGGDEPVRRLDTAPVEENADAGEE